MAAIGLTPPAGTAHVAVTRTVEPPQEEEDDTDTDDDDDNVANVPLPESSKSSPQGKTPTPGNPGVGSTANSPKGKSPVKTPSPKK
jgi:hypothetical protein